LGYDTSSGVVDTTIFALRSFKTRLLARDLLIGPMITLRSTETAELLAGAGYDWLFIDTEHSPLEPAHVHGLLQAAAGTPRSTRRSGPAGAALGARTGTG